MSRRRVLPVGEPRRRPQHWPPSRAMSATNAAFSHSGLHARGACALLTRADCRGCPIAVIAPATETGMQTPLSLFQRRQLEVIARVTPHSMAAHILNTTVLAVAMAGSIATTQLVIWCTYSYAVALLVL